MTNFTMLICNRPKLTKQALDSLALTPEITIAISEDRKCDSETSDVITEFQSEYRSTLVCGHTAEWGTGELRNQIIRSSEGYFGRGEYLYLSDNDVRFISRSWLKMLIAAYEGAKALGFKVIGAYNHPYHQPVNRYELDICAVEEVQALALQSMLMTWDVWDKYGPFNNTPPGRVCMGEDVEFGNKIKADGGKLGVVSPALLVNTGITNSFGSPIPGWEMVKAQCPAGVYCE